MRITSIPPVFVNVEMSKIREPDIVFKWTNCCRLCLSQDSTIDLFSEASISQHFPSKIRTCLNLLIYSGDPMPRKICSTCQMKLDNWSQFRKECIQTDKDLRRRLEPYKGLSSVKEYFDKYRKYEKSSRDESISLDSMSEYEEEFDEDLCGGSEMEDEEDDEMGGGYSHFIQREDDYSSTSEKQISSSDFSKINQHGNSSEVNDTRERNDGESRTVTKSEEEEQEEDKCRNESSEYIEPNSLNKSVGTDVPIDFAQDENDETDGKSEKLNEGDASFKTCPKCGVDFPSEQHYAEHSCGAVESGVDSDDNDNFINPLSFVDTSLSELNKEVAADKVEDEAAADKWKCVACGACFKYVAELKEHRDSPNGTCGKGEGVFECITCRRKLSTTDEVVDHEKVHVANGDDREDGFDEEGEIDDGDYVCLKCDQAFCSKEQFDKHELIHNQQDIYNSIAAPRFDGSDDPDGEALEEECKKRQSVVRCFRCGRIFNNTDELEHHLSQKHKNPTPFFCRKCDLRFSARSQLLMHVRSHMRKNGGSTEGSNSDNTCTICNAKFYLQSDLQSHMKTRKQSSGEEASDAYPDNKIDLFARFKCSVCSKIFVHSGSIVRHGKNLHKGQTVHPLRLKRPIFLMKRVKSLALPPGERNFKAKPDEDGELAQEGKWEQDGEAAKVDAGQDFGTEKCPFCEKVFKPTYLPRHIKRNHRGEVLDPKMLGRDIPDDSLVCRYCLKSCSNPHNRRVHESIHYPVKMECDQCKTCGQKFFDKLAYESHLLACKSVRCGKCNKIFFRFLSLKSHSCIVTLAGEGKG